MKQISYSKATWNLHKPYKAGRDGRVPCPGMDGSGQGGELQSPSRKLQVGAGSGAMLFEVPRSTLQPRAGWEAQEMNKVSKCRADAHMGVLFFVFILNFQ